MSWAWDKEFEKINICYPSYFIGSHDALNNATTNGLQIPYRIWEIEFSFARWLKIEAQIRRSEVHSSWRLFFRFKFQKSPFFNRWPRVEKFIIFLILLKCGVYYFIATKVIELLNRQISKCKYTGQPVRNHSCVLINDRETNENEQIKLNK